MNFADRFSLYFFFPTDFVEYRLNFWLCNFYDACIQLDLESQIENLRVWRVFNFSKNEWLVMAEFFDFCLTCEKL